MPISISIFIFPGFTVSSTGIVSSALRKQEISNLVCHSLDTITYKVASGTTRMTLNPNAAEFIPSALWSSRNVEPSGRVVNRTISLSLGASDDDDFTRYWRDHLPDDIIPDFGTLASTRDDRSLEQRYMEEATSGFRPEMVRAGDVIDPLDLLAQKFPGIAIHSLADVLQANGGELSLTIEMLTYFESQDDDRSIGQLQSRLPNLITVDPALSGPGLSENESRSFEDFLPSLIYNSDMDREDTASDFVAAVRKINASQRQTERNEPIDHLYSPHGGFGEKLGDWQQSHVWLGTGEAVCKDFDTV